MKEVATHLAAGLLLLAGLIALPAESGMHTSGVFVEFTATRNQEAPPRSLATKRMCPDRPGTHTFAPALRVENPNQVVITNTFVGFEFTMTLTRSGTRPTLVKAARFRVNRNGTRPIAGGAARINFRLQPGDCVALTFTPEDDLFLLSGEVLTASLFLTREPSSPASNSLIAQTGQTICYDAAGAVVECGTGIGLAQDGDLQKGAPWPNPRFTDNGDGTVTDNLTGLTWLKNADCAAAEMHWDDALDFANTLFDGSVAHNGGDCGLSDGSAVGAWRLPNAREMQSLVHYGVFSPAVPDTAGTGRWSAGDPFSGVQSSGYFSSSTYARIPYYAWSVGVNGGGVAFVPKASPRRVWPVRGGQ